jgi:mono/diheme cytochrome c family protein
VNFTVRRPSVQQGLDVLRNGVPGTPMAPWTGRLDAQEQEAVVHYLRTMFVAGADTREAGNAD